MHDFNLLNNQIIFFHKSRLVGDELFVKEMCFEFFWQVLILQKFVPFERCGKLVQSFDVPVLYFKPIVERDGEVKIRYQNREWCSKRFCNSMIISKIRHNHYNENLQR